MLNLYPERHGEFDHVADFSDSILRRRHESNPLV